MSFNQDFVYKSNQRNFVLHLPNARRAGQKNNPSDQLHVTGKLSCLTATEIVLGYNEEKLVYGIHVYLEIHHKYQIF